jgi:hypothetical protein
MNASQIYLIAVIYLIIIMLQDPSATPLLFTKDPFRFRHRLGRTRLCSPKFDNRRTKVNLAIPSAGSQPVSLYRSKCEKDGNNFKGQAFV